jgi:hypothetical protein
MGTQYIFGGPNFILNKLPLSIGCHHIYEPFVWVLRPGKFINNRNIKIAIRLMASVLGMGVAVITKTVEELFHHLLLDQDLIFPQFRAFNPKRVVHQ